MHHRSKIAALGAAAAAVIALGAGPADAASASVPSIQKMHRGTSHCFRYSWADGTVTTTVYWHNTCKSSHFLRIRFGGDGRCFQTPGRSKRQATFFGPPASIKDTGTKGCFL
ncbi:MULTISPECIES: hypothetical protein [Streptomyces]|uniref:Beta/gamma crystallin 'Greek key' domain-containing protein n=1 Tax=Streptomyces ramulosus TaxID=47762 RepID=A0ABW1FLP3_9ACTN